MPTTYSSASIAETLNGSLEYSGADRSMSPFFSYIGLGFGAQSGLETVFLHYNRRTIKLGNPFLAVSTPLVSQVHTVFSVAQTFERGAARFAFYEHNSWLIELQRQQFSFILPSSAGNVKPWIEDTGTSNQLVYVLNCQNMDPRDPDDTVAVALGMRIIRGTRTAGDGLSEPLKIDGDSSEIVLVACTVACLDFDIAAVSGLLSRAPSTIEGAADLTSKWFTNTVGSLRFTPENKSDGAILSSAVFSLVSNATIAPGMLAGRVSAFPSRGHYPTHYLWDTCFENLALEHMDDTLASDALLQLTENLRADGKMAHFITSTWIRPKASQPPLVGWAGWRLVQKRNDRSFAQKLVYKLIKNTEWWLTERGTRYGLIFCADPLETGWDNTPRLDDGAVLACDMNAYLLMQIRACSRMARMIGDHETAERQSALADTFARRVVEILYDPQAHLFREFHLETGKQLPIKTPACFLPLLGDVALDRVEIDAMIREHLLNPAEFFGAIPFPSVAYDEPTYNAGHWWRGPTWMPIAYFMLQILKKYGYEEQYRAAAIRLYRMIIDDGKISELFDSQTGAGKGAQQQGWTAAILLQLNNELFGNREAHHEL